MHFYKYVQSRIITFYQNVSVYFNDNIICSFMSTEELYRNHVKHQVVLSYTFVQ